MKPIEFKVAPVKQRHHRALFDQDLPFRSRREASKIEFRRRPKHRGRPEDAFEWS
jgi:hypothetical protein